MQPEQHSSATKATNEEKLQHLFERVGAVRHGHFELSSGRHSATYVQCALVLQFPELAERLGRELAAKFKDVAIDCVASPALGGILVGHEVARGLGVRAIFVERDSSGRMALRRGFVFQPGERVLVVEDVWTTGGSTRETMAVVEQAGGRAVAAAALIDRSGGRLDLPVPARALMELDIPSFEACDCPRCRAGEPLTKPGSHFVRSDT
ncbi:MAG TPA: orotate phosphoribosyltransferase [Candidatus Acidoferrales bacterium]|nr:orotate phosphoribosyltransferase [Candidatus Acidoferrales bacterium]